MNKLNNKNVIKIDKVYETKENFNMFMKYYSCGDLHYNICENIINTNNYKSLLNKLINPIYYIHSNNIVHLDLKLENYVLDYDTKEFVLIDFDTAQKHNYDYYKLQYIGRKMGTPHYISPEVFEGYYCKSSDMYSLGCILYTLYRNKFYEKTKSEIRNIKDIRIRSLVSDLLDEDYKYRPTIYDLKSYY